MGKLRIRGRLFLGFGVLLSLIVALAAMSVHLGNQTRNDVSEMRRTSTIVFDLKNALLDVRQGRVAAWSYLATGDQSYLRTRDGAFEQFTKDNAAVETRITSTTGRQLLGDSTNAAGILEAKARAADDLKAKGVAADAPAMAAAITELNASSADYATANNKLVQFDTELSEKATEAATTQIELVQTISVAAAAFALLIGAATALIIARSIAKPVIAMTGAISALAAGDHTVTIPVTANADEIGDMAKALLVLKDNAMRSAKLAAEQEAGNIEIGETIVKAAANDLTTRVEVANKTGFLRSIGVAINQLLEISNETLRDVGHKTRQIAAAATDASAAVGQVSGGVRDQNAALNQVAQALAESAKAIRIVSGSANAANEKGAIAAQLVERGQVSVEQLSRIVETIAQNSRKINQITQVIAGIANRTHILSLNAAIEAARAGEHGKGFVVVAQAVGKLAESSAQNAQQITDIVEQATADATEGRTASMAVRQTMGSIAGEVNQTSQMIRSIAVAMEEQQATVTQIEGNLADLRGIASGNAVSAEEITATMIHLSQLADDQRQQLSKFKIV